MEFVKGLSAKQRKTFSFSQQVYVKAKDRLKSLNDLASTQDWILDARHSNSEDNTVIKENAGTSKYLLVYTERLVLETADSFATFAKLIPVEEPG